MASSPLDNHLSAIYLWLKAGKNNSEIAALVTDELGVKTTEASIRRCIERNASLQDAAEERNARNDLIQRAEPAGIQNNGDEVIITDRASSTFVPVEDLTTDDLLARHNLDPEEWEVKDVLSNQWEMGTAGGGKQPLYQFKVWFKKRVPLKLIFPAVVGPEIAAPKAPDFSKVLLGVICGDQQTPFILEDLKKLFWRWLAHNNPDFGVINGDLQNNGYIGRHRDDPQWDDPVQTAINSSFDFLYGTRQASLNTEWTLVKGNHDDRIRNEQLERNERLYGVTAAQYPGEEPEEWVYSLNHLLHLRRLGINYVEPKGTYDFEHVALSDCIAVRHGHLTGKDAPLKTVERLGHSVVLGHTHKQSITKKTLWNSITNEWRVVTAIEHGPMCQLEGGLGYANGGYPDWQPGFATVTLFPDGDFTADLATYSQDGKLRWRDQLFTL